MSVFSPIVIYSNKSGGDTPTPTPTIANCLYPVDSDCMPTGDCIIPNNVTRIAFSQTFCNSGVKTVTFSNSSVTQLGANAFRDCHELTSVNNTDNVTVISENCFYNCWNLASIDVSSTKQVFGNAFINCSNIDNLNFDSINPQGYFYPSTFRNCTSLNNITLNVDNTFTYYDYCFSGCTNLSSNTCEYLLSILSNGRYNLPYVFEGCDSLTELNLPTVTCLGNGFFSNCANLTTVNIPNCTTINQNCFSNCANLTTVTINSKANVIDTLSFNNCRNLTTINNYENCVITSVTASCFKNCSSLPNITIPNTVTTIGASSFENCSSLATVTFSNNVKTIGATAFLNCTSLTEVVNYESCGVTITDNRCFEGCSSLVNVTLPNKVTRIGGSLFNGCTNLKYVSIPNTVTAQIQNCLTNITSPYFLNNCTSLENISLGKGWKLPIRLNCTNNLTKECMVNIFNNLATVTKSSTNAITLGYGNLIKLSATDIAIATGKNWTIPQSNIFKDDLSALVWEVTETFTNSNTIRLLEFYFYNSDGTRVQPTGCYCDHAPTSTTTDADKLIDNQLTTNGACSISWLNYPTSSSKEGSCRFVFTFESEDVINSITTYQYLYYPSNNATYRNSSPVSWNMYKKLSTTQETLIHSVSKMELPANIQTAIGTDKFEIPTT